VSLRPGAPPAPPAAGPADSAAPAIVATRLSKRYPGVVAVDGIDLRVERGESFAFLGPNGAGKTTTIAMLCTLAAPTSGRIEIAGHDTRTDPAAARRRLGLIFQETTLDGELTAVENLRCHADLYDVPTAEVPGRIAETLALVGLADDRDRLVSTFSGGMRRRLEVARALLHRPQILFLDEPTIGLDPQSRAQIWQHLRQVREREGVTLFLTTHYLEEADQCDRIAIMDQGRIVAEGSPAELKAVLGADRIDLRTADDTMAARSLRERLGLTVTQGPGGLSVEADDSTQVLRRLFTELDVPIHEAKVVPPTLDDVFLHHTGHRIHSEPAAQPGGPPPPAPSTPPQPPVRTGGGSTRPRAELRALRTIWRREVVHFVRDRTGLAVALLQPLLFLFVFGAGLAGLFPGAGGRNYQLFLFCGLLIMAAQGPAISVGGSLLAERQNGFLRELLVSPVHRATLLIGKCLGGATVATSQAAILLAAGGLLGIPYHPGLIALLLLQLALTALAMTAFGVLLATFIRRPQTFGITLSVLMAPLTFLSGTMFPLDAMPAWMRALALANPLTYAVDAIRRTIAAHLPPLPHSLFRPLSWAGVRPPVAVEWALLAAGALLALLVAVRRFSRAP
jgi:daunorubicin resistance ABC transporter ATP-binding subunit/daunorubicin resistance ABC transporter membrane protein